MENSLFLGAPILKHIRVDSAGVSKSEVTFHNDARFAAVYRRIYCRKFFTLPSQMSRYICKCVEVRVLFYKICKECRSG